MDKRKFNPIFEYPQDNSEYLSPGMYIEEIPLINADIITVLEKELKYPFSTIRIDLPFCIHLEDGLYPVRLNGELNIIYNEKVQRKDIPYFGGEANNVEMFRDPRGLFRYSRIEVYFKAKYLLSVDEDVIQGKIKEMLDLLELSFLRDISLKILPEIENKILTPEKKQKIRKLSQTNLKNRLLQKIKTLPLEQLKKIYSEVRFILYFIHIRRVINRFISVYRAVTRTFYLPNFQRSDIAYICFSDFIKSGNIKRELHHRIINPIHFLISDRSIKEHEIIWEALDNEVPISLEYEIMISAQRFLLEEKFSLAVMEAFAGFEILVEQCLLKRLILDGKDELEARKTLEKDRNWQISVRVNTLFNEIVGVDLTKLVIYPSWIAAKKLRDDIVHIGKREVSESEAKIAVNSIAEMMDEIQKYVV